MLGGRRCPRLHPGAVDRLRLVGVGEDLKPNVILTVIVPAVIPDGLRDRFLRVNEFAARAGLPGRESVKTRSRPQPLEKVQRSDSRAPQLRAKPLNL